MAKASKSPTVRTLDRLRERGFVADVAEYWVPSGASRMIVAAALTRDSRKLSDAIARYRKSSPGVRRDLFGFVDVVALPSDESATFDDVVEINAELSRRAQELASAVGGVDRFERLADAVRSAHNSLLSLDLCGLVGIQATSTDNLTKRVAKIKHETTASARAWVRCARLEVWGWARYADAVDRRFWRETVVPIVERDLPDNVPF